MRGNPEVIDYLNMLIGGELAARDQECTKIGA